MSELAEVQRRLHAAPTVNELQARAAAEACAFCPADRAVILALHDGRLAPQAQVAVAHPASDALRLRALAAPVRLATDSEEFEIVRRAEGIGRPRRTRHSLLREPLGLRHELIVPVMPEARVVALLVLDHATDAIDPARAELFGHLFGLALERTVLRARLSEVAAEMRHLTASADALAQEAASAPLTVSTDHGWGAVFPLAATGEPGSELRALLTPRELEVLELMSRGMTNRAIAAELHLAPDTVKANVARVLRKLGASNRVEAVTRVMSSTA